MGHNHIHHSSYHILVSKSKPNTIFCSPTDFDDKCESPNSLSLFDFRCEIHDLLLHITNAMFISWFIQFIAYNKQWCLAEITDCLSYCEWIVKQMVRHRDQCEWLGRTGTTKREWCVRNAIGMAYIFCSGWFDIVTDATEFVLELNGINTIASVPHLCCFELCNFAFIQYSMQFANEPSA